MTSDEQEALSRAHDSSAIVILLRLTSGRFAVYNNARELCGIITPEYQDADIPEYTYVAIPWPPTGWRPPAKVPQRPTIDLKELDLI